MTLRKKIILLFAAYVAVNIAAIAGVAESVYLAGRADPSKAENALRAAAIAGVVGGAALSQSLTAVLLYAAARRMILAPLGAMAGEVEGLKSGETPVLRGVARNDEIGRLAAIFNRMALEAAEARNTVQAKVDEALAAAGKANREYAVAERLAATGRLAAGVAGRLEAELRPALEAVALLKSANLSPERRAECLARCEEGLRRVENTAREMFAAAKSGVEVSPVSVGDALRQAIAMVRHLAEKSRIALVEEIGDREGEDRLVAVADAADLQHVFYNLLTNAIDAMPRGGVLTVRAARVLKWVIVEIVDTGVGLTIDELSASFDYFHTTKPGERNAGLGLSVAQYIVNGYGGALTLNSRKGEGTKATVELPATGGSVSGKRRHTRLRARPRSSPTTRIFGHSPR